ncbi:putative phosphatase regulatory subunit-domain-containing protein [Fennellomyces sp. T-0311]|nr:putative phosphatase regulatory subunit-domain-containing protein [Fennellomyces sp. T-0311]
MLTTSSPSYHHNVFCPTAGTYSSYYYDALRSNSRRSNKRVSLVKNKKPSPPIPTIPEKKHEKTPKKKSVRFSDDNDQVRFFYQWQAPKEDKKEEYKLELVNGKKITNRNDNVITLETIDIDKSSPKLSIVGKCHVVNLAFEKHVMVRYTFDSWKTHTDIDAIYRESLVDSYKDRFTFELHTEENDDDLKLQFALRYRVNGREFWDNNGGENYSALLRRQPAEKVTKIDKEPKAAPWSPIKRGSPPLSNATFINPWTTSSFWIPQHRFSQPHDQSFFPSHHHHFNSHGPMPLIS